MLLLVPKRIKMKIKMNQSYITNVTRIIRTANISLLSLIEVPLIDHRSIKDRNIIFNRQLTSSPSPSLDYSETSETSDPEIFVNPLCLKLDTELRKLSNTEALLSATITHRGIYFVHNLVTTLVLIKDSILEEANHLYKDKQMKYRTSHRFVSTGGESLITIQTMISGFVVRDNRFQLLIRDLGDCVNSMGTKNICDIMECLRVLRYTDFRLIGRLVTALASTNIQIDSVKSLLRIGADLQWAGFINANFYYANLSKTLTSDPHGIESMPLSDVIEAISLFSELNVSYNDLFRMSSDRLIGAILHDQLSIRDTKRVTVAMSKKLPGAIDFNEINIRVLNLCGDSIVRRMGMECDGYIIEIVDILKAFTEARIQRHDVLHLVIKLCSPVIEYGVLNREPVGYLLSLSMISDILDSVSEMGLIPNNKNNEINFITLCFLYIREHLDYVTDLMSIKALKALCRLEKRIRENNTELIGHLIKRSMLSTNWETKSNKRNIVAIWICQILEFPHIEANFTKMRLMECIRQFLRDRLGGGLSMPDLTRQVSEELQCRSIEHETEVWIDDTPYCVDIVLRKKQNIKSCIIIIPSLNQRIPLFISAITIRHLEERGWKVIPVSSEVCRNVLMYIKENHIENYTSIARNVTSNDDMRTQGFEDLLGVFRSGVKCEM